MNPELRICLFACTTFLVQRSGSVCVAESEEQCLPPVLPNVREHDIENAMRTYERHLEAGCISRRRELVKVKQDLEKAMLDACLMNASLTIVHHNIQALIFRLNHRNFRGLNISSDSLMLNTSRHAMYFPPALVEGVWKSTAVKELKLACIYLKASCLFQDKKNSSLLNDDVLGATLGHMRVTNLSQPIEIRFWHNYTLADYNMTCVFWLEGTDGNMGNWSQDGCKTNVTQSFVLCQCHHLTYFAVLLQTATPVAVDETLLAPLNYISDIGCSISASACLLSISSYVFSRKIQHDSTTKIHMNLLGSLFFLNMSFLLSKLLASINPLWLCTMAAAFLHYSLLGCLSWMAVEGFHLYMLVIRVYNLYTRHYLLKLCLVGWGFPGVAVLSALLISNRFGHIYGHHIRTDSAHSNSVMCWITSPTVHHINMIYFGGIILFNVAVLATVVRRLTHLRTSLPHHQKEHSCKDTVTVLGLTCLLGATWTLAFFSFGVFSTAQMFLFTVFNSLQGALICLWYCFLRCRSQEANPGPVSRSCQ